MISKILLICGCVLGQQDATPMKRWALRNDAKCNDGSEPAVYVDMITDPASADGFFIFLQGGGECNYVDECEERCENSQPNMCTTKHESEINMRGTFWSPDAIENPFHNFVKVFVPYCSSDIHQGDNGPNQNTGELIFAGKRNTLELVSMLNFEYQMDSAKKVILSGTSAGGKGAAGNCNSMGDEVTKSNPEVDFRCIPDASGWIPTPVYNTKECDNLQREKDSTHLWNREINPECSSVAETQGLDPIEHCSFETQYGIFVRYPIMFTGSLQDVVFLERHLCHQPWWTIQSSLLAWWIKELAKISLDYALEDDKIGLWITSCPGHGVMNGDGPGGWNSDVIDGLTVKDAISQWALEGKVVHAVSDVNLGNPHCPEGFCSAIDRRTNCGFETTLEEQCLDIGCAWCPSTTGQSCIHVLLADHGLDKK